jgi:hypothetical protein
VPHFLLLPPFLFKASFHTPGDWVLVFLGLLGSIVNGEKRRRREREREKEREEMKLK